MIGQLLLADMLVIPAPRFGVDRFADRAKQAQRAQVVARPARSSPKRIKPRMAVGAV